MLCPKCGYFSEKEENVCPECGEVIAFSDGSPGSGSAEMIRLQVKLPPSLPRIS